MDKKHRQFQGERAVSKLGGLLQRDPGRCNQEENSMEMGQKNLPVCYNGNCRVFPPGKGSAKSALGVNAI